MPGALSCFFFGHAKKKGYLCFSWFFLIQASPVGDFQGSSMTFTLRAAYSRPNQLSC
jgi:hypothetical protein